MLKPSFFFFIAVILMSCDDESCVDKSKKWKSVSIEKLEEFKNVQQEIESHKSLFWKHQSDSNWLYIDRNTENISELPKLNKWLGNNYDSYITYYHDTIHACYGSCDIQEVSYEGCLYYLPDRSKKLANKGMGKIIDSSPLDKNWYYILEECYGCNKD